MSQIRFRMTLLWSSLQIFMRVGICAHVQGKFVGRCFRFKRVGSLVDRDNMLLPDDSNVDVFRDISIALPFAAAISLFLCSFAQSLAFLNVPAPCRKVSQESLIAQPLR